MQDATITLKDGRRLGYRDLGPPTGMPVLYFHGSPGSRLDAPIGHDRLEGLGWRLILPERPGYGLSDRKRGRRVADWPADVVELAGHLGLERFAILGYSAGGPFALACAAVIPERATAVGLVSGAGLPGCPGYYDGMGTGERLLEAVARISPSLVGAAFTLAARQALRRPDRFHAGFERDLCPADRVLVRSAPARAALRRSFLESVRNGPSGVVDDWAALVRRPWGVDAGAISVPVRIWFGGADTIVPAPQARHLASVIPSVVAEEIPGAGHFMILERMETMVRALLDAG
jgi:pimeloyl-ACP methyl ester carboxylesterase